MSPERGGKAAYLRFLKPASVILARLQALISLYRFALTYSEFVFDRALEIQ